jgi:hypothetical protein
MTAHRRIFQALTAYSAASFVSASAFGGWTVSILGNPLPVARSSSATCTNGGTQGGVAYNSVANSDYACIWSSTSGSLVYLHPNLPGARDSTVSAIQGTQQVGSYSYFTGSGYAGKAALWNSTASSMISLHPGSLSSWSNALAIDGTHQYGANDVGTTSHAAAWTGTAASWVDLHPPTVVTTNSSLIRAANAGQQVGYVSINTPSNGIRTHAGLWTGTAASWVDLHPEGALYSSANGVHSGQQVGSAGVLDSSSAYVEHAMLWQGSASSMADLHPSGAIDSRAYAVFGGTQVGFVRFSTTNTHAVLWQGTARSLVDLHAYLPSGFGTNSTAYGIWKDTNHTYIAGRAQYAGSSGNYAAVLWTYTAQLCPADFNSDGQRTIDDIFIFINAWFASDTRCDVDGVTGLSIDDLFVFLNIWFSAAGC